MHRRAFTLIELLVVIAIISLLSSIVLASLDTARNKGRIGAGREFEANVYHAEADQAVGIWDFTEGSGTTVADRSGNGNNGTLVGGVSWSTDVPSGAGNSLLFDGSTGYITIPDSPSTEVTGDLTISMWIKPGSTQGSYTDIVSKHGGGGYVIEQNAGNTNQFYFSWDTTGSGSWTGNSVLTTLTPNVWQQFTVVKNGTSITHYINGAVSASGTASSANISVNSLALRIGSFSGAGGRIFNGYLDQVRIFNKALVASQVKALYALGAAKHGLALSIPTNNHENKD